MHKRRFLIFFLLFAVLAGTVPFFALATDESAFGLNISCPDSVTVGSELRVTVSLKDPKKALAGLEFSLKYDPAVVEPKITKNDAGQMDAFSKIILSGWEQMSSILISDSAYVLRYLMPDGGTPVTKSNELVIEIPFLVKGTGNAVFSVADSEIVGICDDEFLTLTGGIGGQAVCRAVGESDSVSVILSGAESASAKGKYQVTATVTNVGDPSGVIGVEFELCYDKNVFSPEITSNTSSEMDVFMENMPADGWEQMCTLDAENGRYILRFAAMSVGDKDEEILKKGNSFSVVIPFITEDREGEYGIFSVTDEVLAVNADSGILSGVGSRISVPVTESITPVIPDIFWEEDGFLRGVKAGMSLSELSQALGGAQLFDKNGVPVTNGNAKSGLTFLIGGKTLTVCVTGDANGNGVVDSTDYIMAKRMCLGTYEGAEYALFAAAISGGNTVTTSDYVKLKRHVLGTYDIFGE